MGCESAILCLAEWKGLGAQILSCDLEHEHVRQQLLRLDSEFAGEGPDPA